MIDLETLGTKPGSVILSIGAVEFDENNLGNVFHMGIDIKDSVRKGLTVDADTATWWMAQTKEAQQAVLNITANATTLAHVLTKFAEMFDPWKDRRLWCNGAAFDIPILTAAYARADIPRPWNYSNEMDMRTIRGLVGRDVWKTLGEKPTVAHDGLADAIAQARSLQAVCRHFGRSEWLR
jgi:DNA polymerase III epsilon subunit-like protein